VAIDASAPTPAQARAVIEALRAGIASTGVSEIFTSGQARILNAFGKLLDNQRGALAIEGGYGQGKTHLLKHLASLARRRGYVVSLVPLSKETPFNHWWHVYAAAIQEATTPEGPPGSLEALLRRHRWPDEPIQQLHAFAEANLHPRLPALLAAYYQAKDPEVEFLLAGDLLGQPVTNAAIAAAYRAATGERVKLPPARLQQTGLDYFRLTARLFELSGYTGWLILFDEFELVCKLGTHARGRAYANLHTFLRNRPLSGLERVIVAVTLIDQMTSDYLVGGKEDITRVPSHFRGRAMPELAADAERTIRWLVQSKKPLAPLSAGEVDGVLDRIAGLHELAYGWQRPEGRFYVPQLSAAERMRTRVRFCVETLDLTRLYGETPQVETREAPLEALHEDEEIFTVPEEVTVIEVEL